MSVISNLLGVNILNIPVMCNFLP